MNIAVIIITKLVMFIMDIVRLIKGTDDDMTETEIMELIDKTIEGIFR